MRSNLSRFTLLLNASLPHNLSPLDVGLGASPAVTVGMADNVSASFEAE
jgi:mevalonate kinase